MHHLSDQHQPGDNLLAQIATALSIVIITAAASWFVFGGPPSEPTVSIHASPDPIRRKPDDPGGITVPYQNIITLNAELQDAAIAKSSINPKEDVTPDLNIEIQEFKNDIKTNGQSSPVKSGYWTFIVKNIEIKEGEDHTDSIRGLIEKLPELSDQTIRTSKDPQSGKLYLSIGAFDTSDQALEFYNQTRETDLQGKLIFQPA